MTQYTLKNACMAVLILLAGIALSPTWAGGDNYEAKIKIIGDDFELDEADVSNLEPGESMSFYTDSGREVLVVREDDGFDISIDGESLDLPSLAHGAHHGGGFHGVKIITKDFVCDDEDECVHDFISIDDIGEIEVLDLLGEELALDFQVHQNVECDDTEDCSHNIKVLHYSEGQSFEFNKEVLSDFTSEDGSRVIIIKNQMHIEEGEEI